MNSWMLAGAALVAFVFLLRFIFANGGKVMRVGYQKRDYLFSSEERAFLNILDAACGDTYRIFGRIPVTDLLTTRHLDKDPEARRIFDTLEPRRFSFVVCDRSDLGVVCVIQIDDVQSVSSTSKRPVDPLSALCESAGLGLIRIDTHKQTDAVTLREQILATSQRDPLFAVETDGRREPRFSNFDGLDL
ncbi:MAG: DUF2726 domain-containing protein [Methylococcaceae bacterium]